MTWFPLPPLLRRALLIAVAGSLPTLPVRADDWPMWRHDPARSAITPEELPPELHLQWTLQLPPLKPAWDDPVNQDRMPFDRVYEPIVMGNTIFIGSNRSDAMLALSAGSGVEKWRFYANGPIRFAPVAGDGRVLFSSDDGYLYCLSADTGALLWRRSGGPDQRKILGNGRLISMWPARGGVVLRDGIVYYAAGIWPFMGVFIHAVDAASGETLWTADGLSSSFINHPHGGSVSFGGIAPQGALALAEDRLLVPGGRSMPACLDSRSGEQLYYHISGSKYHEVDGSVNQKREGGSHVSVAGNFYFNHHGISTSMYDIETGELFFTWPVHTFPLVWNQALIFSSEGLGAQDLGSLRKVVYETTVTDKKTKAKKKVQKRRWGLDTLWELPVDSRNGMIIAGSRLYTCGAREIAAVDLSNRNQPTLAWKQPVEGTPARLLAANGRLFLVTLEGTLHAYGGRKRDPPRQRVLTRAMDPAPPPSPDVAPFIDNACLRKGVVLVAGGDPTGLARALARDSDYHVLVTEADPTKAERLRRVLHGTGIHGHKAAVLVGTPETLGLPPYLATISIVQATGADWMKANLPALFRSTRPYGGSIWISRTAAPGGDGGLEGLIPESQHPGGRWQSTGDYRVYTRDGPPPGAADWTHLYGDIANTSKSDDTRAKLPLGLLWFGGNTHEDVLPRHSHGPAEQVVAGRLFIQGINLLSARDVYTGAVLWRRRFDDLGTFGIYYDKTYVPNPLDTTKNQHHIAGANARGTNYVVTEDRIYLAKGAVCLVLDPADGNTLATFQAPEAKPGTPAQWAYIGVYEDILIGGRELIKFSQERGIKYREWKDNQDTTTSRTLFGLDRHSGRLLWIITAKYGFRHNAVVAGDGKIYCIDALPPSIAKAMARKGATPPTERTLTAYDVRTGSPVWRVTEGVFGTWLSYSREHDTLVQAGRDSKDMPREEPRKRMSAYRGRDGAVIWDRTGRNYGGPIMLHGDTIYLNAVSEEGAALSLLTGKEKTLPHPLTGTELPWRYHRRYGCSSVIASEHLLTFRSGAAGHYDLTTMGGTGNLGGFRSGCTANLVVANGVLNAPDYTRTCTCSYQNQTSLALVHMPDVEVWTFNQYRWDTKPIQRLGVNFGAPGDRREGNDTTLWLDFPSVGGPSPDVPITITPGSPDYYRHHSSWIEGGPMPWVAASGLSGECSVSITLVPRPDAKPVAGSRAKPPIPRITCAVTAARDDAEEREDGKVFLTGSGLELATDNLPQTIGLRFASVAVPKGVRIETAHIQFEVDETDSADTALTIHAQAADNALSFATTDADVSGRQATASSVTWNPKPWTSAGERGDAQRTPDLAPLVREIVSRPGWRKDNAIVFVITGSGKRVAKAYDGDAKGAPVLHVGLAPSSAAEDPADTPHSYTVRLVFVEPGPADGTRRFDVTLQGETVLSRYAPGLDAQGPRRSVIKEFRGVKVFRDLRIGLASALASGTGPPPILAGVEAVREN